MLSLSLAIKQSINPQLSLSTGLLPAYLECLELLEHMADDASGRRLVGVRHGTSARLGAESLAQPADAAPGAQVHLAGDRSCKKKQKHDKIWLRLLYSAMPCEPGALSRIGVVPASKRF